MRSWWDGEEKETQLPQSQFYNYEKAQSHMPEGGHFY